MVKVGGLCSHCRLSRDNFISASVNILHLMRYTRVFVYARLILGINELPTGSKIVVFIAWLGSLVPPSRNV